MLVSISNDYKEKPVYERKILGKYLLKDEDPIRTNILLLWRKNADSHYLKKFKNLKSIIRYGTGYDNVDLNYLKEKKIKLYNNPEYCLEEVSDTALSLILSRMRRCKQYDSISKKIMENTKLYKFKNTIDDIERISTKNIGVIGSGKIGKLILKKSSMFFKNVGFYDPNVKSFKTFKKFNNLKDLLKWSDVISINANLNKSNKHLINRNFLKNIKNKSIIINLARFEFIENLSLVFDSIKSGKIDYFAIDLEMRDIINQKKLILKFLKLYPDNLSVHPHSSFYSKQSYIEMRANTAEKALKLINNKKVNSRIYL